jgi:hypothetical protein
VTRLVHRLRSDAQESTEDSDEVLENEASSEPAPELDLGVAPPASSRPAREERAAPGSQGLNSRSTGPR